MRTNKLSQIRAKTKTTNAPQASEKNSNKKHGDELKLLQVAMDADLATLKNIPDLADKAKLKAEYIPKYWDFISHYFADKHHYANSILVQIMIWLFDISNMDKAVPLALAIIKQGVHTMPPQFGRNLETFVCDEIYDWSNAQLKQDKTASPYLDDLIDALTSEQWDVHVAVKSKIYAMQAKHKMRLGEYQNVLDLCDKAIEANPEKHGVKKLRQDAEKKLKPETK